MDGNQSSNMDGLKDLNSDLNPDGSGLAIILAAGHGKRIKSTKSKMLHQIWGKPTVTRVAEAAYKGLGTHNQAIVVGIKGGEVAKAAGKMKHRSFVYQAQQNGTGDAVRVALEALSPPDEIGSIYVLPGDMGLIDPETLRLFKQTFTDSRADMMVLTGTYTGPADENYYGRIIRVPGKNTTGKSSGKEKGNVIEIKEHKDIQSLPDDGTYQVVYKGNDYAFTKNDLFEIREFNTGVFAFKPGHLRALIEKINTNNAQGELYLTDLISIYNKNALTVAAFAAPHNTSVLGFNTKSVLLEMNEIARSRVYDQLKDIIAIEDRNDFFIADKVVDQLLNFEHELPSLDIFIGKGALIETGVSLNVGARIEAHARLCGRVELGKNCHIGRGVHVSGTVDEPTRLGNNVKKTGISTISNCKVEDEVEIEHSILIGKSIKRVELQDGSVQPVRFVRENPQGLDAISDRY